MVKSQSRQPNLIAPLLLLISATGAISRTAANDALDAVDFNRDIRPILSDSCFHCHGPDESNREAGLRLDTTQGLVADLGGYSAVVPGKPESSELIRRILHQDPDQRMPPANSGRTLNDRQISLLNHWIKQGAERRKHWSFAPPKRPTLPSVKAIAWPRNAIDHFVLARLEREGLTPSPAAGKETLIRRVTFDLTGLPPTLEEIDAFIRDNSPQAFETLVDRLLASPRYGERMAMQWLDAARYADTHGYSLDRRRVMWPWRDWVIKAYNDNMPFDQFMTEQLAGDLLPNATVSQTVATGFNRNHPIQSEGGVINEEYRVETVVDRVETTASVFLGLTIGCCRCHDHKYDPFSHTEFYQFYAFFNNVPETAHVGNSDNAVDGPVIKAPSVLRDQQLEALDRQISSLQQQLSQQKRGASRTPQRETTERVWIDDEIPTGAQSLGNSGGKPEFEFVSKGKHPVFSGQKSSVRTSPGLGQHLVQNANPPLKLNMRARLFAHVYLDPKDPPKQIMLQWNDGHGWDHRAYWGANVIDWGVNGSPSRRHMGPLPQTGVWTRLEVLASDVGLAEGSALSGWAFTQFGGTVYWDKAGVKDQPLSNLEIRLSELKTERKRVEKSAPTVMVMAELSNPRKTFALSRGQYDRPSKQAVRPGVPAVLGTVPNQNANRLDLANWLSSRGNPLTARVTVNRYWRLHFGVGLVKTMEDFGSQGEWPSHPQLLDWLAVEFMDSDWDTKAMHKLIVMSATYQQSSHVSKDSLRIDPQNRLYARGPRLRLDAEMIRDQALAASGLLVERLGGESVRPYQPPGLWDDVVYQNVPRFTQDHGQKLYRRSLYTYWKRSVPPPSFQAFDAPTREACTLQRSATNTPLAALVLMNDPTFVEASRKLAERVIREAGDQPQDCLKLAFRLTTGRFPNDAELQQLGSTHAELLKQYEADRVSAKQLLSVGESTFDESLDTAQLAAYAAVANALLQLDEVITRN